MDATTPDTALPIKRSIKIDGRKTSLSIEDAFWNLIKAKAQTTGKTVSDLVAEIDQHRRQKSLSAALRLAALAYATEQRDRGH